MLNREKKNEKQKTKMARRNIKKQLENISLGVVLVLFWVWMYVRVPELFPQNVEGFRTIITTYILFATLVFGFDSLSSSRAEKPLFRVAFVKAVPKFLIASIISLVVLFFFGLTLEGNSSESVFGAIKGMGVGVLLLHALFIATLEEKVFRSWLTQELQSTKVPLTRMNAIIVATLIFAFFHYLLGGEILILAIYIPLGFLFALIREKFSPETDMANSGVHFAWNVFVLGMLSF